MRPKLNQSDADGMTGRDADAADRDSYAFSRSELRRRSLAGVFYLTSSSFASLLIGLLASLVLARMLTPSDFGVVAIGSTALLLASSLADGGLGAGMVRRPEPPKRNELATMNGIQLFFALAVCVPIIAFALTLGRTGAVTAIMIASLPIMLLQTPGRIVLLREMSYDRTLAVEFGTQLSFQSFCVISVALGAGVWGLAVGAVVRAVVGTMLTAAVSIGFVRPSLRGWRTFGGLIRFGLSFQATSYTFQAREQGLNVAVGAVAGVAPLGIWTFANRVFQLPALAFGSLYVIGFPAMSNLLARGEDPAPVILRTVRRAAIAATFVFPAFAAASPELIPSVFGDQWREAALILPFLCFSTLFLGSIAVAATSYLSAAGRPGVVAWASASLGVVWIAGTVALLPALGIVAIGVANLAGAPARGRNPEPGDPAGVKGRADSGRSCAHWPSLSSPAARDGCLHDRLRRLCDRTRRGGGDLRARGGGPLGPVSSDLRERGWSRRRDDHQRAPGSAAPANGYGANAAAGGRGPRGRLEEPRPHATPDDVPRRSDLSRGQHEHPVHVSVGVDARRFDRHVGGGGQRVGVRRRVRAGGGVVPLRPHRPSKAGDVEGQRPARGEIRQREPPVWGCRCRNVVA